MANGEVWTELPSWATDEQAYEFDGAAWSVTGSYLTGDLAPRADLPSTFDATGARVLHVLREEEHAVAVWEDAQAQSTDPWVAKYPEEPLAFLGDEVYYLLTRQTATEHSVAHGLTTMVAWWGSPAMLATPPAEVTAAFRSRAPITREQLQTLVDHVQLVYFDAYDGLGYIFWRPSGHVGA